MAWARGFLDRLHEMDHRHIFTIALYTPPNTKLQTVEERIGKRWFETDQSLDVGWYISKENSADAGNMVVSGIRPSRVYHVSIANNRDSMRHAKL